VNSLTNSKILNFLYTKWLAIWALFRHSLSYKLMRGVYRSISGAWAGSAIVRAFCRDSEKQNNAKSIVYKILYLPFAFLGLFSGKAGVAAANWWKSTLLYKAMRALVTSLIALETRFLGIMLFCVGGVMMAAERGFSTIPLCMAGVGAVLCIFEFSLTRALNYSIIKPMLKTFLGIQPTFDYVDEAQTESKSRLIVAAIAGILIGFGVMYVSPLYTVGAIGVLVMLFSVELGIGITVFAIPFLPTMLATGLGALCFVSLILRKIGNGDKEWKLDGAGMAIMLFMAVFLICTISSVAWKNSMSIFVLYLAFIAFYFTIINTIKTREQLYSMLMIFVLAGVGVAIYGILQYVLGLNVDKQAWMDEEMFSDIRMRVYSTLENPNVLGEYLLLVIPVAVAFLWRKKELWAKVTFAGIVAVLGLCLILTMSRGCWIALLVALAIYITFVDGRYWLLAILVLFALPSFLPDSILNRFLSVGDMGDSSSSYRLFIWLGTIALLRDFWVVGIGPGSAAYNTIYPRYSYSTIIAPHSHNLFLQITTEMGAAGLLAFVLVCVAFLRRMAASAKAVTFKSMDRAMIVAISAGFVAFLVQGMFDYAFYNYRVVMMFWMYLAFGMCFRNFVSARSGSCEISENKEVDCA